MARALTDPTPLSVSPRAAWLAVTVAVVALSLALALRERVGVWVATGLAAGVGIAAATIAARAELRRRLKASRGWISMAIALGAVMALATHALHPLGVAVVPGLEEHVASLYRELRDPPGPRAALPVLAAVVLAEELVFRGLLVALLERWAMSRAALVVIATAIYVVPQIASGSIVLIALAASCGAVWTWQRVVSGSVLVPLITHALWDVLVFVVPATTPLR